MSPKSLVFKILTLFTIIYDCLFIMTMVFTISNIFLVTGLMHSFQLMLFLFFIVVNVVYICYIIFILIKDKKNIKNKQLKRN